MEIISNKHQSFSCSTSPKKFWNRCKAHGLLYIISKPLPSSPKLLCGGNFVHVPWQSASIIKLSPSHSECEEVGLLCPQRHHIGWELGRGGYFTCSTKQFADTTHVRNQKGCIFSPVTKMCLWVINGSICFVKGTETDLLILTVP